MATKDEKRAFKLLTTYNGTCPVQLLACIEKEQHRIVYLPDISRTDYSHLVLASQPICRVVRPPRQGVSQKTSRGWKGVQMGKDTKGPDTDIDQRIRCLQHELDRVAHNKNPTFISSMLHVVPQLYTTNTLRLHLETEIDRLLREQVSAFMDSS